MQGEADLRPEHVAVVIPTRGDVPLDEVEASIPAGAELMVWDNSRRQDLAVYARYAAIDLTDRPVIVTQDDDCVLAPEAFETLLAEYLPGVVTANMPPEFRHDFYRAHCLVGFGAIFDRELPEQAFARIGLGPDASPFPEDRWWNYRYRQEGFEIEIADSWIFHRTCDIVFTALTPRKLVDVPYRNLPHATGPDRMYRQPQHVGERQRMLDLALKVRDAA